MRLGIFWRALPHHGFGKKGSQCKGGKKAKQRVTVALIANAAVGKKTPMVMWTSSWPWCFKQIDTASLPVHYFNQLNAWMTVEILESVLSKLTCNRRLHIEGRKIILLLDNAGCLADLKDSFSNVKKFQLQTRCPSSTCSHWIQIQTGSVTKFPNANSMRIQCTSIASTLHCAEPNSHMHDDFKWPHLHTAIMAPSSASHHIASRVEQICGTLCVARRSALTVGSRHERACHTVFGPHAKRTMVWSSSIWIETTSGSGLGLIRIGFGLGECTFSVNALKPDSIWFNAQWVSSVDRPLDSQGLFKISWSITKLYCSSLSCIKLSNARQVQRSLNLLIRHCIR